MRRSTLSQPLTPEQARELKRVNDDPVELNNALIMCLLLNEHLNLERISQLRAADVDLLLGVLYLDRQSLMLTLTPETYRLLKHIREVDHGLRGFLIKGAECNGTLSDEGMRPHSIYNRVKAIGEAKHIPYLTPNLCHRYNDPSAPAPPLIPIPYA